MDKHRDLILLERLAAGGMAEVYRAKQLGYQGFEKIVAVKRILPQFAEKKNFKRMFVHEANLSATLEHPNIAHVYANGENKGYLYLIMEYIDGHNLRQLIGKAKKEERKISTEMIIFIVSEILKGLEYAHSRTDEFGKSLSIVHRDVSPQNIMLSYDGGVKIVDFGIARVATADEPQKAKGPIMGKFSYMSPEQARGENLDRRSDIYSAGIILWELLAGTKLFNGENDIEIIEKAQEGVVPRPSEFSGHVPTPLENIVMKALERDPLLRYSTCLEFYSDLIRYQNSKRSDFIPTDFSSFMKEFFKEEMLEKRRLESQIKMGPIEDDSSEEEVDADVTRVSINPGDLTDDSAVSKLPTSTSAESVSKPQVSFTEMAGMIELQPVQDSELKIRVIKDNSEGFRQQQMTQVRPVAPEPKRGPPYIKIFLYTFLFSATAGVFYIYAWPMVKDIQIPTNPWGELVKLRKKYYPDKDDLKKLEAAQSSAQSSSSSSQQWSSSVVSE